VGGGYILSGEKSKKLKNNGERKEDSWEEKPLRNIVGAK